MKELPSPATVQPRGDVRIVSHAAGHPQNHLSLGPRSSCYGILLAATAAAHYPQGRYLGYTHGRWQKVTRLDAGRLPPSSACLSTHHGQ